MASVHDLFDVLPTATVEAMFEPRYRTAVDASFLGDRPNELGPTMALVTGTTDSPTFVFDADLTIGIDPEAQRVVDAVRDAHRTMPARRRARARRPARDRQQRRGARTLTVRRSVRRQGSLAATDLRRRRPRTERRRTARAGHHHRVRCPTPELTVRPLRSRRACPTSNTGRGATRRSAPHSRAPMDARSATSWRPRRHVVICDHHDRRRSSSGNQPPCGIFGMFADEEREVDEEQRDARPPASGAVDQPHRSRDDPVEEQRRDDHRRRDRDAVRRRRGCSTSGSRCTRPMQPIISSQLTGGT